MTTSRIASTFAALAAAALSTTFAPAVSTPSSAAAPARASMQSTVTRASASTPSARRAQSQPYSYRWPVKPFGVQHPVRGFFGDPRISNHHRTRQFHFGIDISAPNGTPVYATITGRVWMHPLHATTVEITGPDGVEFSYWHVIPTVRTGDHAVAYKTVIGHIEAPYAHVHFSEAQAGRYVNPLRPGALGPYTDTTFPTVFRMTTELGGRAVAPKAGTEFDLVLEPRDETPLAVPRPWYDLPVMPALVRCRVVDAHSRVVLGWRTIVDFRETIPSADDFDRIWASGTTQNHVREPGRYRLFVARGNELRALHAGAYTVELQLSDTSGNTTRSSLAVRLSAS
jgi:peptidase M23-like protein